MGVTADHGYVESFAPGHNVLPARAWPHDDSERLSLNGDWAFRLSPSLAAAPDSLDPAGWDTLAVPSHWQLHGYGRPAYTNGAGQTFNYRYRGLRLLVGGDDRLFLVPQRWAASNTTLVVPLDGGVRVQFQFENDPP